VKPVRIVVVDVPPGRPVEAFRIVGIGDLAPPFDGLGGAVKLLQSVVDIRPVR
jgi:hypothetical protein